MLDNEPVRIVIRPDSILKPALRHQAAFRHVALTDDHLPGIRPRLISLTITLLHSVATAGRSELFSVCNLRYLCLLLNDFSFFLRIFRCASDVLKLACSFLYKHLFLDISVCSFQCTIFYSCWLFLISHYMLKFLLTSNHWSNQHLCKTFSWMISFLNPAATCSPMPSPA